MQVKSTSSQRTLRRSSRTTQRTTTSPEGSPTKGTDAQNLQNSESEDEGSTKEPSQRFSKLKKLKMTVGDEEYSDKEEESSDEESSDDEQMMVICTLLVTEKMDN